MKTIANPALRVVAVASVILGLATILFAISNPTFAANFEGGNSNSGSGDSQCAPPN